MPYRAANYRQILANLHDGVYLLDRSRTITYWNPGAERLSGYRADETVGHCCGDGLLVHTDEAGCELCKEHCPVAQTLVDGLLREATVFLHHRDGHRVPVAVRIAPLRGPRGQISGVVQVFNDDSARVEVETRAEELGRLAHLDALTDLPNRLALDKALGIRKYEAETYGWPFGVVLVDLDHFKLINDIHGHDVGDGVLKMVARTLLKGSRATDTVGRWGGEEFLIVAPRTTTPRLAALARRLRGLVEASSLGLPGEEVRATASFGVASARRAEPVAGLVKRADIMLYRSKQQGRNRVEVDSLAA